MIISVRKLIKSVQMWILIGISTVVMYQFLQIVHTALWQADPYKPPKGHSIRVDAATQVHQPWYEEDLKRLRVFYITGE